MRVRICCLATLLTSACLDDTKARAELEALDLDLPDAAAPQDASGGGGDTSVVDLDEGPSDAATPTGDAGPSADVGSTADVDTPTDLGLADLGNGTPEVCNGEDEDEDDRIDEGVANRCGGCGGLPEEGCQAWRVEVLQNDENRAQPARMVGLQGNALGFAEREIEGGLCVAQTVPPPHPDAHLGIVNVNSVRAGITLVPRFDAQRGAFAYDPNPDLGALEVFVAGDVVDVLWGGGRLVGSAQTAIEGPEKLRGVDEAALAEVASRAQGQGEGPVTVTWSGNEERPDDTLRFFIGGSVPIFNRNVYRAIRSYQLDARVVDDGELRLDDALFLGGVPDSSVWVYLRRERSRRVVLGPHSVEVAAAWRKEARGRGSLERDDPAPFDIVSPSPDERLVRFGEPIVLGWTPPPAGTTALDVQLVAFDLASGTARVLSCRASDPASGALVLPAELTADWPSGDGAEAQLSMQAELATLALPAPERGAISHAVSLILQLRP